MTSYIRFDENAGRTVGAPRNKPGDGDDWYPFKIVGRRDGSAQGIEWRIDGGSLIGEWVAKGDPLDKPVNAKAVNTWRLNEEKKPLIVDGVPYDFCLLSRERMRACVQCWYDIEKHGPRDLFDGKSIIWRSADNRDIKLSYAKLRDLETELTRMHALRIVELHHRSGVLKRGATKRDLV